MSADTREQHPLVELCGNPRVAYRRAHGERPAWMRDPPLSPTTRTPVAPRGPRSHRKPRSTGRRLVTHALAALTGALVFHLIADLL
ncbi:hypothetical protein [Nocardiopsis lucentensis]|uniref:hypothetical protein n=1 Tax=Nocardiopsis lucentensis TaxID=53441 RepID=UPI0003752B54|nr:hypothetical protein [Nocardiopsis lucentensis]